MSFEKIKPQKGSDLVLQQLKAQIMNGELQPGTKLDSIVDLAVTFGVGRSTIREALSALKAMGWLDIQQGGGTYVKEVLPTSSPSLNLFHSNDSLKEILEVRRILETGCASLAAEQRSEEDLQQLEHILKQMSDHIGDEDKSEEADTNFHLHIAKASGNSLLIQLMESLSQRLQETMKDSRKIWFYAEHATAIRLLNEHQSIYEAIKNQDIAEASMRMLNHIVKVESVLREDLGKVDNPLGDIKNK